MSKKEKVYLTAYPHLIEQWHPTLNGDLDPDTVTHGSARKVWWRCGTCSGTWKSSPNSRTFNGRGRCPYCSGKGSGKKVLQGFNDLTTTHTHLVTEWSPKNGDLTPEMVGAGSGRRVWWRCSTQSHEWLASVSARTGRGDGCPYCSGRRSIPGETDLSTTHPELVSEWSPKNKDLTPEMVSSGSNKKVWWVCTRGHEWAAQVSDRALKTSGCPFCAGKQVYRGFNDLNTTHPELADEWSDRNALGPGSVTDGSGKKVWWLCERGHEWEAAVAARTARGRGCPYCTNHRTLPGFNDLTTTHPELASEWSPKNEAGPDTVVAGSHKKVWWRCVERHEWVAAVYSRALSGNGCPKCCLNRTSRVEGELFRRLSTHFPDSEQGAKVGRWSVDVLLPAERSAIEYDGSYFHKDSSDKDARKTLELLDRDYRVVRVRERSDQYTLPPLTIEDPHYLELTYDYHKDWAGLSDVVDKVVSWVEKSVPHAAASTRLDNEAELR